MIRVLVEASALVDARRDAGIGRYARQLIDALAAVPDVTLNVAKPSKAPISESRPVRFIHAQPVALRMASQIKPDVLHGVGGEPVAGFPLARQVVTVHDVELWRSGRRSAMRDAALRAYALTLAALIRECGAIIAVSTTSATEAVETLRLNPRRVHVVPEGVGRIFSHVRSDVDDDVVRAAGLQSGAYVLWVGSLRHHNPRKGIDVLIEAAARLGPGAAVLALAGAQGPEAARVEAFAQRVGCTVVLCGHRNDAELAALYRNAAVVALTSTHEGFGLPALEAMACAAPVVATAAGNLPDLCGDAALFVPVADAAAISGALRAVLDDSVRAAGMREAGVARSALFTWERVARDTADVYRSLALSNSSRTGTGTSRSR